jgi:hypothetical protein
VTLPLRRHAKQRVVEEVTLYLLKRYSEWYQNAVTTICSRAARVFRHTKRMSALGQKQTFAAHKGMSALPPTATSIAYSADILPA